MSNEGAPNPGPNNALVCCRAPLSAKTALISLCLVLPSFADTFTNGTTEYRNGNYAAAAIAFTQVAAQEPAAGTLVNLGLAEWHRGRRGHAVLAWEQALWVSPSDAAARENLRYARKEAQLEAPDLAWHEAASLWLPVNAWAVLAGISLWFAIGMVMLPRILHWKRASWHQALAAAGFALFLLCLPSLMGVRARARIGYVLEKETPLRLTPTRDAQTVALLAPGQPARRERERGNYVFIRTNYGAGWVERAQFGLVSPE